MQSGIHCGLVIKAKDGDIYGRTVNVAARLEGRAGENEIVCSETVKSKLTTEMPTLKSLGELTLKNIPKPVECFSFSTI